MHFTRISIFIEFNKTLKKGKGLRAPKRPSSAQLREQAGLHREIRLVQSGLAVFAKRTLRFT
jgi:hypothetical protein